MCLKYGSLTGTSACLRSWFANRNTHRPPNASGTPTLARLIGKPSWLKVGATSQLLVTVPKGESGKLKAELVSQQPLIAPLAKGQQVGTLRVTFDGKPHAEYPVVALDSVGGAGLLGRAWDTLRLWFK